MNHHVAVIEYKPAFLGTTFHPSLFLMFLLCDFQHALGKRVEHAIAGTIADNKIICKGCDVFDVKKQNVFALFVLQSGDDLMCKVKCVQISPLNNFTQM